MKERKWRREETIEYHRSASSRPRTAPLCILAWALSLLIGCASTPVQAAPPTVDRKLSDERITDTIEEELLFDRSVTLNDINVSTSNGIVTLSGKTSTLLEKDRAKRIAMTVKGVRSIVDRIAVEPYWTREDWEIEQDAEQALRYDPATDSWEIDVSVEDGVATLSGEVDSYQETQLAETVVKGVKGVKGVDNKINIAYKANRTDYEIQEDVEAKLRWDTLVDDALVTVEVDAGTVKLSGTVGSAAERSQAVHDAWVAGVKAVDDSGLQVELWARDPKLRKKKYVKKTDKEIRKAVEDTLLYDPRVSALEVMTGVENGVVTLRGVVDNLRAKRAAEQDARNTVGTIAVKNHIRIQVVSPEDHDLAKRIRNILYWDPYVERYELDIDVINGIAYLSGTVDSYFEKARADDLAAATFGVHEVRNNIKVRNDTVYFAYNPYIYRYDPLMYEWYVYEPGLSYASDEQLERQIENQIWWSPYVDLSEVKVEVKDGIATLSGKVDSWWERREAMEEAFEGGATWVRNKVEIN